MSRSRKNNDKKKKKTKRICLTEEQSKPGKAEKEALSALPDICMYLKSFPIKFIMNLIQSPMAQRNVPSNKKYC